MIFLQKFRRNLLKPAYFLAILATFWPSCTQAAAYVVGNLMGQFGNQMFIIAAATSLALDHGAAPLFPDLLAPKNPKDNISFNYQKVFYHLNTRKPSNRPKFHYQETSFNYAKIPFVPNMEITGYFQSEKYFINHKNEILKLFAPHPEIVNYLNEKYTDIINHPETVSVHVRSYLKEDPEQKAHITYGVEFFEKAIMLFPETALIVVFSNQIEWCRQNFSHIPRNLRFIEGEEHHYDFYLMSMCKHNIICNSSFSWWAAYLNRNPRKIVIAPPLWFNPSYIASTPDLLPPEWVVLH